MDDNTYRDLIDAGYKTTDIESSWQVHQAGGISREEWEEMMKALADDHRAGVI